MIAFFGKRYRVFGANLVEINDNGGQNTRQRAKGHGGQYGIYKRTVGSLLHAYLQNCGFMNLLYHIVGQKTRRYYIC